MPKRKSKGVTGTRKSTSYGRRQQGNSRLKKQYAKVKRKQRVRLMRRTIKSAKSRALNAMAVLRQPKTCVMRFQAQRCMSYTLADQFKQPGVSLQTHDNNPIFPATGIKINLNSIYDPWAKKTDTYFPTADEHAGGFDDISHQYGQYRVIGAKVTFKVRRLGGSLPIQAGYAASIEPTGGSGTGMGPSPAANLGEMFDPSTMDPVLVTSIDRNAWQDANSMISEAQIGDYVSLQKFKHLPGINWRELKAGAAQKASIVNKWSERGLQALGMNTDKAQINGGLFHNEQGSWTSGGSNPSQLDHVTYNLKPFDGASSYKTKYSQPRVLVTIDIDYLVKCSEPRFTYSNSA